MTGDAPKFTEPLKPVLAKPRSETVLTAVVVGSPLPTVLWFAREKEIVPDETHAVEFNPETGRTTLTISEVTELDETVYSIKAVNVFGRAECKANLVISKYLGR